MHNMSKLNSMARNIIGKPMTSKEQKRVEELRAEVKSGKITVQEAHAIWDKEMGYDG